MFIELTEILRCPNEHEESYVVCVPVAMDGRRVVRGGIGCPSCGAEYPIVDGIAYFGEPGRTEGADARPAPHSLLTPPDYDAAALLAFIDLQGRGGYVLLAGRAARHGPDVAALAPGVQFVGVNPPPGVPPTDGFSILHTPRRLPVKSQSVRAVVLGADCAGEPWLADGARVLLRGLRFVAENEEARPEGIADLARGAGLLVGEKS